MSKSEKYDLAKKLAIEVESYCFILFNEKNKSEIVKTYRAKNRSLLMATRNEMNYEIRCRVVTGELKPDEFVQLKEEVNLIIR